MMDPNAAWKQFLLAAAEHERDEAMKALENLEEWMIKGGHPPDGINPFTIYNLLTWIYLGS